jgi:hypothetical protein
MNDPASYTHSIELGEVTRISWSTSPAPVLVFGLVYALESSVFWLLAVLFEVRTQSLVDGVSATVLPGLPFAHLARVVALGWGVVRFY